MKGLGLLVKMENGEVVAGERGRGQRTENMVAAEKAQ